MQAMVLTAQNYFGDQQMHGSMPMNYGHQGQNGAGGQGFYGAAPPQSAYSYGNVSYIDHGGDVANHASMESMKNGLDIIRNLFPEHQRGGFDPRSYQQVESRMATLQNHQLPFLSQHLMSNVQTIGVGGAEDPYGPGQYSLPPMDNLRTKNDLINLDQLFATMQSTIYENQNEIAAAGLGQPGAHYVSGPMAYRNNSPPQAQMASSHRVPAATPSSHHRGTPTHPPPSIAVSNTSGNSPPSMHLNMSPTTPGAMYPTLPGPSHAQGYMPSNMAPTSTLGSQFDPEQRRRYSGGRLQRAAPASLSRDNSGDALDLTSDGSATPKNAIASGSSSETDSNGKPHVAQRNTDFSNSNLDPALGGATSPPTGEMSEGDIRFNDRWLTNVRTIETLRALVKQRLDRQEYDKEDLEMKMEQGHEESNDEHDSIYPMLRKAADEN